MTPHGRVLQIPSEQACDGWCRKELDAFTAVVPTSETGLALMANDVWFDGYAVAGFEGGDRWVNGKDCAGGFVTEDVCVLYNHGSNAALDMVLVTNCICVSNKHTACQK